MKDSKKGFIDVKIKGSSINDLDEIKFVDMGLDHEGFPASSKEEFLELGKLYIEHCANVFEYMGIWK